MTFAEIIEGLQIFSKYEEKGLESFVAGAEHDIFYGTAAEIDYDAIPELDEDGEEVRIDTRMSAEDQKRLGELGWFIYDYSDCWAAFV